VSGGKKQLELSVVKWWANYMPHQTNFKVAFHLRKHK